MLATEDSTKRQELSDIVDRSIKRRRMYHSRLSPRQRSLIGVCKDLYNGDYSAFLRNLRKEYGSLLNARSPRAVQIYKDIETIRKIQRFQRRYRVNV